MASPVHNIVILTGAGISAESGVPTFRSKNGTTYWEVYEDDLVPKYHRVEEDWPSDNCLSKRR